MQKKHIANKGKKIPHAKGLPLMGQTLKVMNNPLGFLKEMSNQYPDLVKVRLGLKDYYLLQTPEAAKHVLLDGARNFYKPGAAKLMKKVLGEGLATSNGDLWLRQRRLMQPAFHKQRLTHFFAILQFEISKLIGDWKLADTNLPVNVSNAFFKLTLNNLTKSMFGVGVENRMEEISGVLKTMLDYSSRNAKAIIKIPLSVPTKNNLQFLKAEQQFERVIYGFIEQRLKGQDWNPSIQHNDMLQLLLTAHDDKSQANMTLKQLRDEITTIFLAGHETTSQTLSWIFYRLALQPNIYKKAKEEAAQIETSSYSPDALPQLPYIRSLIEEAMRYYPPVWIIGRKSTAADIINDFHLPAGSTVLLNVYGMHHNPCYFKAPETFDPSHLSPKAKESLPSYLYLPFGGGQRLCIGNHFAMMVMQSVIVRLVKEFSFSVPINFAPTIDANLTLRAKEGIHLFIQQSNAYANSS